MEIKRGGAVPSVKGADGSFNGTVWGDLLFDAPDPAHVSAGHETVEQVGKGHRAQRDDTQAK